MSLTHKHRKFQELNMHEFAKRSPEPCLISSKDPMNKEHNRVIRQEERNMYFLVSHFSYLNTHAMNLLASIAWTTYGHKPYAEIHRVPYESPYFGIKKYRIRYAGTHGVYVKTIFMITNEEEQNIDLRLTEDIKCKECGSCNYVFKIKPSSSIYRCGYCLSIPDILNRGH
jgi:hypothetical protein